MLIPEQTHNRLKVLKAIRHAGPVARSQLPGITGLSAGTITNLTSDLLARDLIVESREQAGRRGRPRSWLTVNAQGGIVVGASVGTEETLQAAFVDLTGKLLHACEVPLARAVTLPQWAMAMVASLETAIERSPFDKAGIRRIGLVLPAIVDTHGGIVHYMATMPPGSVPFAGPIAEAMGLPVSIENDVSNMARAEHWFGRAQHLNTFTLIALGITLGSAAYADGLPLTGANGISQNLSHVKIDIGPQPRPCYCGGYGCATAYASMFALLNEAGMLDGFLPQDVGTIAPRFAELVATARAGDKVLLERIGRAGSLMGIAVANHINACDPGDVLIVLPMEDLHDLLREPFDKAIETNVMPGIRQNTRIAFAVEDDAWRWKGSAALALEQAFLSNDRLP